MCTKLVTLVSIVFKLGGRDNVVTCTHTIYSVIQNSKPLAFFILKFAKNFLHIWHAAL